MDNQNKKSAQGLASLGRGPDTELVHMTPNEVMGLQTIATNMGGQLTINPRTGLPEAGFLDSIFPTIAGFGLAALTGGTSLAFVNPFTVGLGAGALTTAITGDLKKGLGVGLGVGGGYGLGTSLMGAGAAAGETAATEAAMKAPTLDIGESRALGLTGNATRGVGAMPPAPTSFQLPSANFTSVDLAKSYVDDGVGSPFLYSRTGAMPDPSRLSIPPRTSIKDFGKTFTNVPSVPNVSVASPTFNYSDLARANPSGLASAPNTFSNLTATATPDPSFFSNVFDSRAGQNFSNMGRGITQIPTDKALRKSLIKPGIASLAGGALNVDPPKPFEIEDSEEDFFYPEGGYTTTRKAMPVAAPVRDTAGNIIPSMGEATYFNPNQGAIRPVNPNARNVYDMPYFNKGGIVGYANGGLTAGAGDGMSDDIPAVIAGEQPAALSPGEFVVPADVVSDMGNGSSRAGARQLYAMMDRVRKARGGSVEQPKAINTKKMMPA